MKLKFFSVIVVVTAIFFPFMVLTAQTGIPISTYEELNTIVRGDMTGSYYLINDIEIPEGTEWLPLGKPADWDGVANNLINFTGTFDGNGYSIKNIKITSGSNFSGLFARIVDCTIKNLGLENVDITGGTPTGALAGVMFGTASTYDLSVKIDNVFVTGSVKGVTEVGGLVGRNNNNPENTIRNCYVNATVEATNATGAWAGGIVGCCNSGRRLTLKHVYAAGIVKTTDAAASNMAGGILGYINNNNTNTIVKLDTTIVLLNELAGGTNGIFLNRGTSVANAVILTDNYAKNNLGISSTVDGTLFNPENFTRDFFENIIEWNFTKVWKMDEGTTLPVFSWNNLIVDEDDDEGETPPDGANKYEFYGFKLLDYLNDKYYNTSNGLYTESINSSTLARGSNAFIWPAAHMIRALSWGALIDSKYKARTEAYANRMDWYINGEGYGCIRGGQRFFDDNGLISYALMLVYEKHVRTQSMLNKSLFAANYCLKYRDEHWALPQTEPDLGQGIFYVGPVNPMASAFAMLFNISGDSSHLEIAKTYYDILNNYDYKIKSPTTLLFKSGSRYADGVWTENTAGPRAANTCGVAILGVRLYAITGETRYLDEARAMTDAVLNRWYKPGAGFSEISMWGGNAVIDLLCELYDYDPDPKWYNAAKDIVDFLIDHTRDNKGFYPTGSEAETGKWNLVRTNLDPPETIAMMSQACAANAILRFAYLDLNKEGTGIILPENNTDLTVFLNNDGNTLNIREMSDDSCVDIYSLSGKKVKRDKGNQIDVSALNKGIYIVQVNSGNNIYINKFIK